MNVIQRTMFELAKKARRKKIPQFIKDDIIAYKRSNAEPLLHEIVNYIWIKHQVKVSVSHCCKILNDAGIRDESRRERLESDDAEFKYLDPPFNPKTKIFCPTCRLHNCESKDWEGHCYACAVREGRVKYAGELEVQEELFT